VNIIKNPYKEKNGFTLVEILVVIIVLGILAGLAVPRLMAVREKAEDAAIASVAGTIKTGLEIYFIEQEVYPPNAASWGELFMDGGTHHVDSIDLETMGEYNISSFSYQMQVDGGNHYYLMEFESVSTGRKYYLGEKGYCDASDYTADHNNATGHSF